MVAGGRQVDPARLVQQTALDAGRTAGVRRDCKGRGRVNAPDQRRGFELHINALRAILEKPATHGIALVVALDKFNQLVVFEQ